MLLDSVQKLESTLRITEKRERLEVLRRETASESLWNDPERASQLNAEKYSLERLLSRYDDAETFSRMENDLSEIELRETEALIRSLENEAVFTAAHDSMPALVSIHAGTGGTDAMDWAEMLQRMYIRFVESGSTEAEELRPMGIDRSKWSIEVLNITRGEEAGIKTATLRVVGNYAYGLLKSEAGVHRLVRQSPFNAKGLRQTSFALLEVIPELPASEAPVLREADLSIDVFRSGGAGGQHVNTTDSAVRITHIPTGIVVSVQNERSQHQNKATAMSILQSRVAALEAEAAAKELSSMKGEVKEGSWGNQIRSYVLHPYQLVKDHRTDYETSDTTGVLNGRLAPFIEAWLRYSITSNQ